MRKVFPSPRQMQRVETAQENPFYQRSPIKDPADFYGRTAEVEIVLNSLKRDQCVSLVGPRRIGKTSLLNYVSHPQVMTAHDLSPDCYMMVLIDCQGLGHFTPADLYELMLDETAHRLALAGRSPVLASAGDSPLGFAQFKQAIKGMEEAGLRLVYLLDEFELLVDNKNLDKDFFGGLRSIAEHYNVAYVTTTPIQLHEITLREGSVLGSPFFNIFRNLPLGLMPTEEARQLLTEPSDGRFSQADVESLLRLAGPHPFFLQIAAYHMFDVRSREMDGKKPTLSDQAAYARVSARFTDEADGHFHHIWEHLTLAEKQMLDDILHDHTLANGQRDTLQSLENKCLVRGGRIFSKAFADFARWRLSRPILSDPVGSQLTDRPPSGKSLEDLQARIETVEELLRIHRSNLRELERQKAYYGLAVPLPVIHNIELQETRIRQLEQELAQLRQSLGDQGE
jgi:hypothetical protein